MNTNLNLSVLIKKATPILGFFRRYAHVLFFILLAGIVVYLLWDINTLSQAEPDDDAVTSKLQNVQRLNVDQSALGKIQELQDQNIEVKSLFEQARNNPFSE